MSQGCSIGIGQNFDLGLCIKTTLIDWTPDWIEPLLPYWPWAAVIVGAGVAYKLAGAPGLAAFAAAIGFILGRRSVNTEPDFETGEPVPKPKQKKKGLFQ